MQFNSTNSLSRVDQMSAAQRLKSPVGGEQKTFVRKKIATVATDKMNAQNGVPTRMLAKQIHLICKTCEKMMEPSQAIRIQIDGSDRILFRTRTGDAVGLQTNEEYINGSKNGCFLTHEGVDSTMKVDNRYLTTFEDTNYAGAGILLNGVISAIGADMRTLYMP